MTSLNIAVLFGGSSKEAEVSKVSAREVAAALKTRQHQVTLVHADRHMAQQLVKLQCDVVFPALHGAPGEDGTVQGLLEMLELPYVGSGVEASALAMNKRLAKLVFRASGLPLADDLVLAAQTPTAVAVQRIDDRFKGRVIVKPTRQGSGLGVTPVHNANELPAAFSHAAQFGDAVLIEEFVVGREITVAVLDLFSSQIRALPVIEIRTPANTWYDYHHRYTAGASQHLAPQLPAHVLQTLQNVAINAHQALGCRDLSRADFVVADDHRVVLLEVNTLPGMTPTSLYPDAAGMVGLSFPELLEQLVQSALARTKRS